jgi:hypothetical protein
MQHRNSKMPGVIGLCLLLLGGALLIGCGGKEPPAPAAATAGTATAPGAAAPGTAAPGAGAQQPLTPKGMSGQLDPDQQKTVEREQQSSGH